MKKIAKDLVYKFNYLKLPLQITAVAGLFYLFIFWILGGIPLVSRMVFFENPNFIIFNLPMNVNFRGISMIWNIPIIFIFTAIIAVMAEYLEPDNREIDKLKKSSMFFLAYIIGAVGIGLFCALISISVSIMACCLIMIVFFGLATLIGFFVEGLFLALGILIGSVVGMFFVAYIHFWPIVIILITITTLKFVKFIVPKLCF